MTYYDQVGVCRDMRCTVIRYAYGSETGDLGCPACTYGAPTPAGEHPAPGSTTSRTDDGAVPQTVHDPGGLGPVPVGTLTWREHFTALFRDALTDDPVPDAVDLVGLLEPVLAAEHARGRAAGIRDWVATWPTSPGDGTFLAQVAAAGRSVADWHEVTVVQHATKTGTCGTCSREYTPGDLILTHRGATDWADYWTHHTCPAPEDLTDDPDDDPTGGSVDAGTAAMDTTATPPHPDPVGDALRHARACVTQYVATAEKWRYDRVVWAFAIILGEIPADTPEPPVNDDPLADWAALEEALADYRSGRIPGAGKNEAPAQAPAPAPGSWPAVAADLPANEGAAADEHGPVPGQGPCGPARPEHDRTHHR